MSLFGDLPYGYHANYTRPAWDAYFLEMVETVRKRATCDRGRAGAILVKNNHILTAGYVGSPPGLPHCDDVGHLMGKMTYPNGEVKMHCLRTTHAEMNALIQAARLGVSTEGATLYCTMSPCLACAKLIIGAGVRRVVVKKKYQAGGIGRDFLTLAGIDLVIQEGEAEYFLYPQKEEVHDET